MLKKYCFTVLAALVVATPAFADDTSCDSIAKSCLDAGFTANTGDKQFWLNCMKPLVMGKTVEGVTVDAVTVKSCRTAKIKEMTKELSELKKVSNK